MKKLYFSEREKRLSSSFSKKNDYYKDCYLGETKPILERKIKDLEKKIIDDCKVQLKASKNKAEKDLATAVSALENKMADQAKKEKEIKKINESLKLSNIISVKDSNELYGKYEEKKNDNDTLFHLLSYNSYFYHERNIVNMVNIISLFAQSCARLCCCC